MRRLAIALAVFACRRADQGPDIQVVGESTIVRAGDPFPATSPFFNGKEVRLVAAKGETLGIQVLRRAGAVHLELDGATVTGYAVDAAHVTRPSTDLYGGSRGTGDYPDGLTPAQDPTYFEIVATRGGTGTLTVGERAFPVELRVAPIELPPLPRTVWAYEDPRELVWAGQVAGAGWAPSTAEQQCIALFARHGVLLSPDLRLDAWPERRAQFAGFRDVPVIIPDDPALAGDAVRAWLAALDADHAPFAIPIDEPRTGEARAKVKQLAAAVRAANDGRFRFAVTSPPDPALGDIDLYISWRAPHLAGDRYQRWTYNGAPPFAGNMVVDAEQPGLRTWGWIAWRWNIPIWYAWDALYWHDRHNRHGAPLPGRATVEALREEPQAPRRAIDPVSYDDGDDHGNRDGVLALPAPDGCRPTLRLAMLRRGLQDRQLLELAARCNPTEAAAIAERLVPRALGDAGTTASWPSDEPTWEAARRALIALAVCRAR